jgi:uncharacterized coiled-coil protein SlyX
MKEHNSQMKSGLQSLKEYSAHQTKTLEEINSKCNWLLSQQMKPAQKETVKSIKELLKLL